MSETLINTATPTARADPVDFEIDAQGRVRSDPWGSRRAAERPDYVVICIPGTFASAVDSDTGKRTPQWYDGGEIEIERDGALPAPDLIAKGLTELDLKSVLQPFFVARGDDGKSIRVRFETLNWSEDKPGAASGRVGGGPAEGDRSRGVKSLFRRLNEWTNKRNTPCLIVAHSHGGNIAIRAIRQFVNRSDRKSLQQALGVITIGSPLYIQRYTPLKRSFWGKPFLPTHFQIWLTVALVLAASFLADFDATGAGGVILFGVLTIWALASIWIGIWYVRDWLLEVRANRNFRGLKLLTEISSNSDEVTRLFPELAEIAPKREATKYFNLARFGLVLREAFPAFPVIGALNIAAILAARSVDAPRDGLFGAFIGLAQNNPVLSFIVGALLALAPSFVGLITGQPDLFKTAIAQLVYGSKNNRLLKRDLTAGSAFGDKIRRKLPVAVAEGVRIKVAGSSFAFADELKKTLADVQKRGLASFGAAKEVMRGLMGSSALFHNAYFKSASFRLYLAASVARALRTEVTFRGQPQTDDEARKFPFATTLLTGRIPEARLDANFVARQALLIDLEDYVGDLGDALSGVKSSSRELSIADAFRNTDVAAWRPGEMDGERRPVGSGVFLDAEKTPETYEPKLN